MENDLTEEVSGIFVLSESYSAKVVGVGVYQMHYR